MEPFEPIQQKVQRELEPELVVTARTHDRLFVVRCPQGDLGDVGIRLRTMPVAAWELSLGIWLVVKGFRPSPLTSTSTSAVGVPPVLPVG